MLSTRRFCSYKALARTGLDHKETVGLAGTVGKPKGSDIVLEAILEAEVAQNAKHFFSQPGNQIPEDIPKRLQKDASSLSSYMYSSLEGKPKGSDIVLEAILEAEVAQNAKHFFSQPGNQIPEDIPKRCRREERGGSCIVAGVISRGEEPV
ncbi:uncharacterized protein A4U43_C07F37490 [Asparagus officinalis]|uniref:Uncharacterized protein n=1 Tax=Asparagus officinalis TaxID=4686 RepID=A0A5P1EHR3_ASPOF|nr:uncharacterized protein A4U43_C07F37490 [Asparagus officinalis]